MELNKIVIGKRIKLLRQEIKLTQEELATKLGLNNKSSISQYEKGDAIPSDDIKFQMCNIFNCSLDYLLGKTDIRNYDVIEKEFHRKYDTSIKQSGLTEEEIQEAIRIYKEIKYGKQ